MWQVMWLRRGDRSYRVHPCCTAMEARFIARVICLYEGVDDGLADLPHITKRCS